MKSERSAATDDTPDLDDSPRHSGSESGTSRGGRSGNGKAEAAPADRARRDPGPGHANGRVPAAGGAAPPEPAGDAPGPVVDGLPAADAAAETAKAEKAEKATTSRPKADRKKRSRTRPSTTPTPAPVAEGGSTTEPEAAAEPAGVDQPAPAAAATSAPLEAMTGVVPDPLAVPELVNLPRTEADDPATDAEPAPKQRLSVGEVVGVLRSQRRTVIRSRKVRRVIRHIDPWSVLTFSVIFHLCLFGSLLLAGSLVWSVASASGIIDNIESFIRDLGDYETWEIQGDAVLRAGFIIAGMLTLASTVLMVLLTVVFNLISDLVGGIRVTVVEEEVHHGPVPQRK